MTETKLGKITGVRCGFGGYDDVMLGIGFVLGGQGWGVHAPFLGTWAPGLIKVSEHTEWTEADRDRLLSEAMRKLGEILQQAKKNDVTQLIGVPVEVAFADNAIKSWRVLTEVV